MGPTPDKSSHTGKASPRWAFMRTQAIGRPGWPDYLWRLRIIMTPWFGVMLHKIMRPDSDEWPHDHPWSFISIMLKGGYTEQITQHSRTGFTSTTYDRCTGSMHTFRRGIYHKIIRLHDGPAWTLVFTGRRRASWGFLVGLEHRDWKDYLE